MSNIKNIISTDEYKLKIKKYTTGDTNTRCTPADIAYDMINLVEDAKLTSDTTFFDIFCKSGSLLLAAKYKLLEKGFSYNDVIAHQLFGICPDEETLRQTKLNIYGNAFQEYIIDENGKKCEVGIRLLRDKNGIIYDSEKKITELVKNNDKYIETIRETFKDLFTEDKEVKFDIVVGNPPYTRGIYTEFVFIGKLINNICNCWITPATFQTSDVKVYKEFREKCTPYIQKIIYYPDCIEIFGISENSGIAIYLLDKYVHDTKDIVNKCYFQPMLNSQYNRELTEYDTLWNKAASIVNKLKDSEKYKLSVVNPDDRKKYTVCISKQWCGSRVSSGAWDMNTSTIKNEYIGKGGCIFNPDGTIKVLGKIVGLIDDQVDSSGNSINIFTSDNEEECKSFISWLNTKLFSFLILINLSGSTIMNDRTLKYIPAVDKFDHIYTDEELYNKYELIHEEQDIINNCIRQKFQI